MKFKLDENLPVDLAGSLADAGYDATTVAAQGLQGAADSDLMNACKNEGRALITLDLAFADIQLYPPRENPGLIVVRAKRQDKEYLLSLFKSVIALLAKEPLERRLWIVEEGRVRIRSDES